MGAVLQLDADDAAKFWPIYKDYDDELNRLNKLSVANSPGYAQDYAQMTDEKADELVRNAFDFQKQRDDLFAKYYGKVKAARPPKSGRRRWEGRGDWRRRWRRNGNQRCGIG